MACEGRYERMAREQGRRERQVAVVYRHLALVAVEGPSNDVAATPAPGFVLHIDDTDTDAIGYLALIEANHAAHAGAFDAGYPPRPPLDVSSAVVSGDFVTVRIEPHCLAHFRLADGLVAELWMTVDWAVWMRWLGEQVLR